MFLLFFMYINKRTVILMSYKKKEKAKKKERENFFLLLVHACAMSCGTHNTCMGKATSLIFLAHFFLLPNDPRSIDKCSFLLLIVVFFSFLHIISRLLALEQPEEEKKEPRYKTPHDYFVRHIFFIQIHNN